jgi:hypothetical protein
MGLGNDCWGKVSLNRPFLLKIIIFLIKSHIKSCFWLKKFHFNEKGTGDGKQSLFYKVWRGVIGKGR